MRPPSSFRLILLAAIVLIAGAACAPQRPAAPEGGKYYVTTKITYLRDSPGYQGNLLGQLYLGDQVERLESHESGWWQVRSARSGQIGWVQGELLSPTPVLLVYFYVTHTATLRECAQESCPSLQLVYRGDQVQKIEENDRGWVRVLVARSRTLGWLPGAAVSEQLEAAAGKAEGPYYYVAVRTLKLRQHPALEAEVVKTLRLNDQLQKVEVNPTGWVKVRQPASGAVGWVMGRYLETLPVRWAPRLKQPAAPKPGEEREGLPEPEAM